MALMHWNPRTSSLAPEIDLMNNFFRRMMGGTLEKGAEERLTLADWAPVVDITETKEAYEIHAELPGLKKEDVKVRLRDGMLVIEGERKVEKEDKGQKFHRVERSYGAFTRAFTLPEDVIPEKLIAEFKDGLLKVKLPRNFEAKKTGAIDIPVK